MIYENIDTLVRLVKYKVCKEIPLAVLSVDHYLKEDSVALA